MISLIKLKNGTEIIGEIKRIGESILIEDPMQINYKTVDYTSLPVISFSRYCPFSSEDLFSFDMDSILHVTPVRQSLEEYYKQAIGYHKDVVSKHLDEELFDATLAKKASSNSAMQEFLKKVKIDGYAQ